MTTDIIECYWILFMKNLKPRARTQCKMSSILKSVCYFYLLFLEDEIQ